MSLTVALLSACSTQNDPAEALADYNERIARVLDAEKPPATPIRVPTWPSIKEIALQPADVRIGVFADLEFGRCSLLREISERNSLLGRVQSPSQRLLYEMRLLRGLHHCAGLVRDDVDSPDPARREFARTVLNVLELKRRDLPLVYWNATFGAPEMRDLFSVGVLPMRLGETGGVTNTANAIAWLAALGRAAPGAPLPAPDAMEQQYYQLVGHKYGGRVWLTMDLAIRELDRASLMLELASEKDAPCLQGKPDLRLQRLTRIHEETWRRRLSPWTATTAGEARVLGEALEQLWQAQQVTAAPALAQYRQTVWANVPGSLREQFTGSIQRHEQAWRTMLQACETDSAEP